MNDTQKAKIQKFLADSMMSSVVLGVIRDTFLKKSKDRDVQNLASRFLCVELLDEAEAELGKYSINEAEKVPRVGQIGL